MYVQQFGSKHKGNMLYIVRTYGKRNTHTQTL